MLDASYPDIAIVHREKGLVESKHMWFIFVLTHVVSYIEPYNELNQLTERFTAVSYTHLTLPTKRIV